MSIVEPSEYVPVAVNFTTEFTVAVGDEFFVIAMEDNIAIDVIPGVVGVIDGAATTVKLTGGLVNADRDAVILAVPTATPVAKPLGEMVATPGLSLSHVT